MMLCVIVILNVVPLNGLLKKSFALKLQKYFEDEQSEQDCSYINSIDGVESFVNIRLVGYMCPGYKLVQCITLLEKHNVYKTFLPKPRIGACIW